jgi:hypothetical protein
MAIVIRVDNSDIQRLKPSAVNEAIGKTLSYLAVKASSSARVNAPKHTSTLANSIIPKRRSDLEWEVVTGQQYAPGLEFGGGHQGESPGGARLYALRAWVKAKGLAQSPKQIALSAWRIGKSIQASGVAKQPFMKPAYDEAAAEASARLRLEFERAMP